MHKKPRFHEVHMLDSLFLVIYNIVSFRLLLLWSCSQLAHMQTSSLPSELQHSSIIPELLPKKV